MNDSYQFRKARDEDLEAILLIIEDARKRMKAHQSGQWQDGSPSRAVIEKDIKDGNFYVAVMLDKPIAVMAVLDYEEAYESLLSGEWAHQGRYKVIHRFAVASDYLSRGVATFMLKMCEALALAEGVHLIRIDTHEKNIPMVKLLKKNGYQKRGSTLIEKTKPRIVFEKLF